MAVSQTSSDATPVLELRETISGYTYGARRNHNKEFFWRQSHWVAPMFSFIPHAPGPFASFGGRAWTPIDDNHVTVFTFGFRVDRPFNEQELKQYESGALFPVGGDPTMQSGYRSGPIFLGWPMAVHGTAWLAVSGILAGLHAGSVTRRGQVLTCSLLDGALAMSPGQWWGSSFLQNPSRAAAMVLAALDERSLSGKGQYIEVPHTAAAMLAMSDVVVDGQTVHETFPLDREQRGHAPTMPSIEQQTAGC